MSSPRMPLTLALLLTTSLAGAQTLQMAKVEVESDPKTDFSTFKTFRWKDSQVPAENPIVHTSVTVYVERGLTGKGLTKSTDANADLWVRYYTSRDEKVKGTPSQADTPFAGNPAGSSTRFDIGKQTTGRLVLELYRAKDAVLVWKGSTTSPNIDKDRLDTEVSTAVRRLMARYPPPKPAAQ